MFFISAFSLLYCSSLTSANIQSIGVRGQLMCGDLPLEGADVKLWLIHTFPRPDAHLASTVTDENGYFQLTGTDSSIFTIDPVVRLYHRCNNLGIFSIPHLCQREMSFSIPATYIVNSCMVDHWYDMGTLNVEAKQHGEQTHCLTNPIRTIID